MTKQLQSFDSTQCVNNIHSLHYNALNAISVRDKFRSGGLKSLARLFFFHCLHENQVVFA